jgi:glycolate oxidase iron-sulfur subunit
VQTSFSPAQLADSGIRDADKILRACVHCGFCLATCPTYVLLGDELDSPRGRIYLVKDMLENDRPASPALTRTTGPPRRRLPGTSTAACPASPV